MAEDDVGVVVRHIGTGGQTIVFVPHHVPDRSIWPGRPPAVIALSSVSTLTGAGMTVDPAAILDVVAEADRLSEETTGISIDVRGKRLVRNQVKAELKSFLADDVLVAAYKQHGSLDKAAAALSEQTGKKVSRDKVWHAVKRAGGTKAILRDEDSGSVGRTVASQRRNRGENMDRYRK